MTARLLIQPKWISEARKIVQQPTNSETLKALAWRVLRSHGDQQKELSQQ